MFPRRSGAASRAYHLSTAGCITIKGNLLDPAKTNMFAQLNRMYDCVILFETPLNCAPFCRVRPRRAKLGQFFTVIKSMFKNQLFLFHNLWLEDQGYQGYRAFRKSVFHCGREANHFDFGLRHSQISF